MAAASCAALVIGGSVTALAGSAAGAVVNPGVTIETWPDLDFVTISGYPVDSQVHVEVFRNGSKIGETTQTAVADPKTGGGLVEINHVGNDPAEGVNDCWGSDAFPNTPNIQAGDEIRATAGTLPPDSSVVRDVKLDTATVGTDTVTFTGSVRSTPSAPVDIAADVLELRVEPAGVRENLQPADFNDTADPARFSHVMSVPGVTEATAEEKMLEWSNAGGVAEAEATEITVATFPEGPPEAMGCPPYEGPVTQPPGEPAPGEGVFTADPTALDFGDVQVGTTGAEAVTLTNSGTTAGTLGTATVTGDGFAKGTDECSGQSVAAGAFCEIEVTATPAAPGDQMTGTLTIPHGTSTITVDLTAAGVDAPPGDIAVSKSELRFGSQRSGRTKTQTLSVRNEGLGALTVDNAGVTGDGYSLTSNGCTSPLAPGQSCNLAVRFTATGAAGQRTGSLTIESSDPDEQIVTVALSGSVKAR